MKNALTIILLLLAFSCKTKDTTEPSDNKLTNTEARPKSNNPVTHHEAEHLSQSPTIHPNGDYAIKRFKDTTINNINFGDCDTIQILFGNQYDLLPDHQDLPSIQILNNKENQLLTMYMIYGSIKCDFQQYQIEYTFKKDTSNTMPFRLNVEQFKSGRGIHLGLTVEELRTKIGTSTSVKNENQLTILIYEEYDNLYFGKYYFMNNKLVKFRYGFENP